MYWLLFLCYWYILLIGQGGTGGNNFYVENILELLDSEMEWFRSADDKLYYMPKTPFLQNKSTETDNDNGNDYDRVANAIPRMVGGGVLKTLINVSGASNVTLHGLTFTHTKITTLEKYAKHYCNTH